ncbi:MAG TPA: AAA family ATPase [Elusimicrobiales bacterium]|nr:AAA family ATPase [Elusimicrobiales bacterium]HOL62814.1 AAA family ATPase [Elusimicrobiales bacterium]HPO95750.1 AAA family ATPase [Elusimicrobiales bacterium]
MIRKLKIKNFRGISELSFDAKFINILVGKNNVGKSSVLEAIDLLFNTHKIDRYDRYNNRYDDNIDYIVKCRRDVAHVEAIYFNNKKNILQLKKISEEEKNILYEKIKGDIISNLTEKYSIKQDKLFGEREEKYYKNRIIKIKKNNKEVLFIPSFMYFSLADYLVPEKEIKHGKLVRVQVYDDFLKIYNKTHYQMLKTLKRNSRNIRVILIRDLLRLRENNTSKKVFVKIENFLRENNILDVKRFGFDSILYGNGIEVPFNVLGDGLKSFTKMLYIYFDDKTKKNVILMDEPDSHMHPGYLKEFIKLIIKWSMLERVQFFIATHSSDLIDLLLSQEFDEKSKKYLEKELNVIRLFKTKNDIDLISTYTYSDAVESINDLFLDLRGI